MSEGVLKTHLVPRYALADMELHAEEQLKFSDQNVAKYTVGAIGKADRLLWDTH